MTGNPLKRPAGPNVRKTAMLIRRKARLENILNSGKVQPKRGAEKKISDAEIEKCGFLLERCENELAAIRPRTVKA